MIEAEIKFAISHEDYLSLPERLAVLGFRAAGVVEQEDHYVSYQHSQLGGWDFVRLRKQISSGKSRYFYTEKQHISDAAGKKLRQEEEREITVGEFAALLSNAKPDHPVIEKKRLVFQGQLQTWPASAVLDEVAMKGKIRYYLEVEILASLNEGFRARQVCKQWARAELGITAPEAPSYLTQFLGTY